NALIFLDSIAITTMSSMKSGDVDAPVPVGTLHAMPPSATLIAVSAPPDVITNTRPSLADGALTTAPDNIWRHTSSPVAVSNARTTPSLPHTMSLPSTRIGAPCPPLPLGSDHAALTPVDASGPGRGISPVRCWLPSNTG